MCTAVVGGSIHRAATRISAASDQRSTTPMTSHRIKDRTKPVCSGVLIGVFGISVTFQNNSRVGLPLMDDLARRGQARCPSWPAPDKRHNRTSETSHTLRTPVVGK